jgi:hypothetical protein
VRAGRARSGSGDDAAFSRRVEGASVTLAFEEFRASHVTLNWASGTVNLRKLTTTSGMY